MVSAGSEIIIRNKDNMKTAKIKCYQSYLFFVGLRKSIISRHLVVRVSQNKLILYFICVWLFFTY